MCCCASQQTGYVTPLFNSGKHIPSPFNRILSIHRTHSRFSRSHYTSSSDNSSLSICSTRALLSPKPSVPRCCLPSSYPLTSSPRITSFSYTWLDGSALARIRCSRPTPHPPPALPRVPSARGVCITGTSIVSMWGMVRKKGTVCVARVSRIFFTMWK